MDFLDRLRDLSKKKGLMNNMQLSKASGVPYTTIDGFYRVGYDNAKLSTLRKLADTLDCSLEYLVNGDPEETGEERATEMEMQMLVKPFRALDVPGKLLVEVVLKDQTARVQRYGKLEDSPRAEFESRENSNGDAPAPPLPTLEDVRRNAAALAANAAASEDTAADA